MSVNVALSVSCVAGNEERGAFVSSAVVTMREASGGRKVTHQVPHAARVAVRDGVLVLQNQPQTEEYFAAPVDLVDHVQLREDPI
jgi:hypothetical protein